MYTYVPRQKKKTKHASTIQRMPAHGNAAINLTPLTQYAITLGDNNTTNGHNAILLEGSSHHPSGATGPELRHWVLVAHFLPKKTENDEENSFSRKLFIVPSRVSVSKGAFYHRCNPDYTGESLAVLGQDPNTDTNVGYFDSHYPHKKSFPTNHGQTQSVITEISKDANSDMKYSLPGIIADNCATWAAKILRLAGIQLPMVTLHPHSVMKEVEKL